MIITTGWQREQLCWSQPRTRFSEDGGAPIAWLASAEAAQVHDERIVATEFADWLRVRQSA